MKKRTKIRLVRFLWRYGPSIFPSALVILSWWIVPWLTERQRKESEVAIWQHTAMSDAHKTLAEKLYLLEITIADMGRKHGIQPTSMPAIADVLTPDEMQQVESIRRSVNVALDTIYTLMPDDEYKHILAEMPTDDKLESASLFRKQILVAMRKAQFPDTEYDSRDKIWEIQTIKSWLPPTK